MTRWARGTESNRKLAHEGSSWRDLQTSGSNRSNKVHKRDKEHLKKTTKTTTFKSKSKQTFTFKPKAESSYSSDTFQGLDRFQDESKPKGLAAELEELKNTSSLAANEEQEITEIIKKDKRREKRRIKRVEQKQTGKVCYNCRETGHDMSGCPKVTRSLTQGVDICFKCGSTEHSLRQCRIKVPNGELPYATCFICKEKGHLSSQCPDNPRGLYPNGGCCKMCGSVEHYKKDCPEDKKKKGIQDIRLPRLSLSSADAEIITHQTVKIKKKGPKIVKF